MKTTKILDGLMDIIGKENISIAPDDLLFYGKDRTHHFLPTPMAITWPRSTEHIQKIIHLANRLDFKVVPSGGRTGLSGGSCATHNEVVVSLERMNRILDFNSTDRLVNCEAGLITAKLQAFAESNNLFFPIDLASAGSSHIGGNVATNAGGNRVIRYGMMRHWVRGLKVVTGKGDLLTLGLGLKKNNAGYDLMQLFIGSEGTLGIICEVTIELISQPSIQTAIISTPGFGDALNAFEFCQQYLNLLSFEYFSNIATKYVQKNIERSLPFKSANAHYALIEHDGTMAQLEHHLHNWYVQNPSIEAIVAIDHHQAKALKAWRENISESISSLEPLKCDIAVRPSRLTQFTIDLENLLLDFPAWELVLFGHIGDGNLHINLIPLTDDAIRPINRNKLENAIYTLVLDGQGTISAEHGIGLLKNVLLANGQGSPSMYYMQLLKNGYDPQSVLNPHKVLTTESNTFYENKKA